jgi:hypothetical protein
MTYLWSLINSLQIVLYLIICPIQFPAIIGTAYRYFLILCRLDYVPDGKLNNIFGFSGGLYPFNETLNEMGYENYNLINNLGSVFVMIVLNVFLICFSLFPKLKEKMNVWHHSQNLMFTLIQGYIEILLAIYLNFKLVIKATAGDKISYYFGCILAFLCLVIVPGILAYFYNLGRKKRAMEENVRRFGVFY